MLKQIAGIFPWFLSCKFLPVWSLECVLCGSLLRFIMHTDDIDAATSPTKYCKMMSLKRLSKQAVLLDAQAQVVMTPYTVLLKY